MVKNISQDLISKILRLQSSRGRMQPRHEFDKHEFDRHELTNMSLDALTQNRDSTMEDNIPY